MKSRNPASPATAEWSSMFLPYIRKTPKRVSPIGALSAAEMAMARTSRVCPGPLAPAAQTRAAAQSGSPRAYEARSARCPGPARAVHAAVDGRSPRPERAADDDRELRHGGGGHRGHELGAVLGDTAGLVLAPDHEAGDVLEEEQRHPALAGQLDEVRPLQRGLTEQNPVVGQGAPRPAVEVREAAHERFAVARLELVELGGVDEPGDDFAHGVAPARGGRDA